jgi:hypothetical protein
MRIAEYSQVLTAMQMLMAIPTMMKIEQNTNVILENTGTIIENTKLIPQIVSNTNAILENTKPISQIVLNTGAILDEVKGLREDIQPGFASRFQQVQADVKAIKARLGMS